VQAFGAHHVHVQPSFWGSAGSFLGTFNMIRLVIAIFVLGMVGCGALMGAIQNNM
jgi:hypothetical protein